MEAAELEALVKGALADSLRGRGRIWWLDAEEVTWMVRLDKLPRLGRFALDVGCDATEVIQERPPRAPNYCALFLGGELLPLGMQYGRSQVVDALNPKEELPDSVRRSTVETYVSELVRYLRSHTTVDLVAEAYRSGDFKGGFVLRGFKTRLGVE